VCVCVCACARACVCVCVCVCVGGGQNVFYLRLLIRLSSELNAFWFGGVLFVAECRIGVASVRPANRLDCPRCMYPYFPADARYATLRRVIVCANF
jgi:hypothetical protein